MRLLLRQCLLGFFLVIALNSCNWNPHYEVKTQTVQLKSTDQIVLISKPLVKPLLYTHVSGLEKLPLAEAKIKFISAVLPSVLISKFEIEQNAKRIGKLHNKIRWTKADSLFYNKIKSRYRARDMNDLLVRMKTPPVSIVLAQAAVESGWGKSRIFIKANNVFGVWSFNEDEPRIAALVKRGNKKVYLRSYATMSQSVTNYFEIIGRARSFSKLREALATTDDPMLIVPYLKNYSERSIAYTKQLESLMVNSNLIQYDRFVIDPGYIVVRE